MDISVYHMLTCTFSYIPMSNMSTDFNPLILTHTHTHIYIYIYIYIYIRRIIKL